VAISAVSQHVIQRAAGPGLGFSGIADRLRFLDLLSVFIAHYDCAVHAYVLMANHVHLLLTLRESDDASHLSQEIRGSYPSIWNERLEVRPIHARRYLLACMRYIELNPVRAGIVARAVDYRWSSFRANALGYVDPIVTPHPLYYALGRSPEARRAAYARFVRRGFARPDIASP